MGNSHQKLLRYLAWSGPVLMVVFSIGLILLARFFPPPAPTASAEDIVKLYQDHALGIRVGCFTMVIGLVFLVPWGTGIAMWTRHIDDRFAILSNAQIACVAMSTAIIVLIPTVWALAAFRPGQMDPDITRTINDLGWFLLLFAWPPFSIWNALVAIAILSDESDSPVFPRWSGYLSIWCALLLAPGGLMAFFKTGPFAWNGIMAFYIPLAVFFVWLVGMTVVMLQASANYAIRTSAAAHAE
jgi:hypothetical protein